VLLLAFAILLGGPVFEHFDHWDHFPQSGNDILLTIVAVLVCFAFAVSLIRRSVQLAARQAGSPPKSSSPRVNPEQEDSFCSESPGFQQLPLRI